MYLSGDIKMVFDEFHKLDKHARNNGWKASIYQIDGTGYIYTTYTRNGKTINIHITGEELAKKMCPNKF